MSKERIYLIIRDGEGWTSYFIRVGIGIFWESGPRDMAKEFTSRALAAKTLHRSRKHLEGWRIIASVR